jgi:hypothetical protein
MSTLVADEETRGVFSSCILLELLHDDRLSRPRTAASADSRREILLQIPSQE